MKVLLSTVLSIGFASNSYAEGRTIRHEQLRRKMLSAFKITETQGIVFRRFPGQSKNRGSIDECEVQLKSSKTRTTLDIIFPQINRSQESVEFSYDREIFEEILGNQSKYSSHYTACSGDQYDTYRDCWQYDPYEMLITISDNEAIKGMTLSFKGNVCTINLTSRN